MSNFCQVEQGEKKTDNIMSERDDVIAKRIIREHKQLSANKFNHLHQGNKFLGRQC